MLKEELQISNEELYARLDRHEIVYDYIFQLYMRDEDDYVDATYLCKLFGKEWWRYSRLSRCKKLVKSIMEKYDLHKVEVLQTKQGRDSITWVHPLVAIDLAEWLSPEFALSVKETVYKYFKADPELTKDLISRTRPENLAEVKQAIEAKEAELQQKFIDAHLAWKTCETPYDSLEEFLIGTNNKELAIALVSGAYSLAKQYKQLEQN